MKEDDGLLCAFLASKLLHLVVGAPFDPTKNARTLHVSLGVSGACGNLLGNRGRLLDASMKLLLTPLPLLYVRLGILPPAVR